jgi:hypothetical protein
MIICYNDEYDKGERKRKKEKGDDNVYIVIMIICYSDDKDVMIMNDILMIIY